MDWRSMFTPIGTFFFEGRACLAYLTNTSAAWQLTRIASSVVPPTAQLSKWSLETVSLSSPAPVARAN